MEKAKEYIVKEINKPTKEQSEKRILELAEFLGKTWNLHIQSK